MQLLPRIAVWPTRCPRSSLGVPDISIVSGALIVDHRRRQSVPFKHTLDRVSPVQRSDGRWKLNLVPSEAQHRRTGRWRKLLARQSLQPCGRPAHNPAPRIGSLLFRDHTFGVCERPSQCHQPYAEPIRVPLPFHPTDTWLFCRELPASVIFYPSQQPINSYRCQD